MAPSGLLERKSVSTVGATVFGVLAALMTLSVAEIPFPILPYLKFGFAEIPVLLAFLLFGPIPGILTSAVQWFFLTVRTADVLGSAIRFGAILSMLFGFWLGSIVYRRMAGGRSSIGLALGFMFAFGVLTRVLVMTIVNYAVLLVIAPVLFGLDYLGFAAATLRQTLGASFVGKADLLLYTLAFTGLFNVLQVLFSSIPSYAIVLPLRIGVPEVSLGRSWFDHVLNSK